MMQTNVTYFTAIRYCCITGGTLSKTINEHLSDGHEMMTEHSALIDMTENMWNRKEMTGPPNCEMKMQLTLAQTGILNNAWHVVSTVMPVVQEHMKVVNMEFFVLKRIVYKLCSQFRSEKSMRCLRQVSKCVKRLMELQLHDVITRIQESLHVDGVVEAVYLPSLQILQHLMTKLQGICALLTQTAFYCQNTFVYLKQHLEIGNMIGQNVVMVALTARLWCICRSLTHYLCDCYKHVYPCLKIFLPTQVPWLKNGETLPSDLSAWLMAQFVDQQPVNPDIQLSLMDTAKQQSSSKCQMEVKSNNIEMYFQSAGNEDLGEPIKRSSNKATTKICGDTHVDMHVNTRKSRPDIQQEHVLNELKISKSNDKCTEVDNMVDYVAVLKKQLKNTLKTLRDVEEFCEQVTAKEINISNCHIEISQLGKKKILNKIRTLKAKCMDEGELNVAGYLRKLRPVLSRMLKFGIIIRINDIDVAEVVSENRTCPVINTCNDIDVSGVTSKKLKRKMKKKKKKEIGEHIDKTKQVCEVKKRGNLNGTDKVKRKRTAAVEMPNGVEKIIVTTKKKKKLKNKTSLA